MLLIIIQDNSSIIANEKHGIQKHDTFNFKLINVNQTKKLHM